MSAAGQCRDCEHFDRDAGGTDGVCLDGRSWRFEVTERWDTKATDTCEFFAAKKLRDLHGEAAEASCPPYGVKGIIPNAKLGAGLVAALRELPKTRRALSDKPRLYDGVHLELSAAEMQDGESQGSNSYFNVPPKIGTAILNAAEKIIRAELKRIGIEP